MPNDIRTYFSTRGATAADSGKDKKAGQKRRRVVDSDDEENLEKRGDANTGNKKPNLNKLKGKDAEKKKEIKYVDPGEVFGSKTPRMDWGNRKLVSSKSNDEAMNLDDGFDESLIALDETVLITEEETEKKHKDSPSTPSKAKRSSPRNLSSAKKTPEKKKNDSPSKAKRSSPRKLSPEKKTPEKKKNDSPSKAKRSSPRKLSPEKKSPQKKNSEASPRESRQKLLFDTKVKSPISKKPSPRKLNLEVVPKANYSKPKETISLKNQSDLETSVRSDEDRFEKKRMTAALYQKFINRPSVINHGCKAIPKGKPGCFNGLTFVVTGVLQSLLREEATDLIKSLGGKVSATVGKRVNYMVAGEESGPKKLATAEELGVKVISEDELLDLILEKSNDKVPAKANESKNKSTSPTKKRRVKVEKDDVPVKKEKIEKDDQKVEITEIKESEIKIKKEIKTEISEIKTESDEKKEIKTEAVPAATGEMLAWVDKYKPKSIKEIIGQQGAASCCVKLKNWLKNWHSNHNGKKKLQKPNPWAKNDDGSFYKAALLSGPPGVGKTTTATLVCQELGFDAVEMNASDTRSRRLLKGEVSELLTNQSLYGFFHGDMNTVSKKHVLLMDEVDGMAGNEDRGGMQELIGLIKDSSIPVICMCNDRNHQKMRSLVNYCYDLRFNKPRLEQIKGPIMSICFREKFKLPPNKIEEIISATNNDIRQTLNYLSLIAAGKDLDIKDKKSETAKKDLKLGPWEVVRKVFSEEEHKKMTFFDKSDLFFNDYSLGPLFVQQNYLSVSPNVAKPLIPRQVARAADSISLGDLVEKRIRSNNAWSLLPVQAMFSSVFPGEYMCGKFVGQINFPAWLGKNSRATKRNRLAQEIHDHTRIITSGSKFSIRLDYAPFLLSAIVSPLKTRGTEGVPDAINVMKEYRLLREDIDSLVELTAWPGKKNPMDGVDSKVKAAFTRAYNKEVMAFSHTVTAGSKKKRDDAVDEEMELIEGEGDGEPVVQASDEEDDDNLENDGLIKAKKPTSKTSSSSAASSSKGKPSTRGTSSRGRGRGRK